MNYQGRAVSEFKINGKEQGDGSYNEWKLYLPNEDLKQGWNEVTVNFFQAYSKIQVGLHTYIDSQDQVSNFSC